MNRSLLSSTTSLLAAGALAVAAMANAAEVPSAPTSAAGIVPFMLVPPPNNGGNVSCADLGYAFDTGSGTGGNNYQEGSGTFQHSWPSGITVVVTDDKYVAWSSATTPILAVVVKGSNAANVYEYDGTLDNDSGLASPVNASGNPAGLSNLRFCSDQDFNQGDTFTISGAKYYDANANGERDDGEQEMCVTENDDCPAPYNINFQVVVTLTYPDNSVVVEGPIDAPWSIPDLPTGTTYQVCEIKPIYPSWLNTGPHPGLTLSNPDALADANNCWGGTVTADRSSLDMGNVCTGAGGGHTLGFWSNRNGQALINGADLAALNALDLAKADGSDFVAATAADVKAFLLGANATNMANMLSAQLAAMTLNVREGFVSGAALVYAGPTSCTIAGLSASGFIMVNALTTAANNLLIADKSTLSGDPNRTCQEFVKNALDNANNNLNFVQATPATCAAPRFPI